MTNLLTYFYFTRINHTNRWRRNYIGGLLLMNGFVHYGHAFWSNYIAEKENTMKGIIQAFKRATYILAKTTAKIIDIAVAPIAVLANRTAEIFQEFETVKGAVGATALHLTADLTKIGIGVLIGYVAGKVLAAGPASVFCAAAGAIVVANKIGHGRDGNFTPVSDVVDRLWNSTPSAQPS